MIQIDPYRGLVYNGYGYGKVVDGKTVHEQLKVYWVSCPNCKRPQPPGVAFNPQRKAWSLAFHDDDVLCGWCWEAAPIREAIIPANNRKPHERCTDRCLSGKARCRCACLGRCHSGGKCYCKKEVPDA